MAHFAKLGTNSKVIAVHVLDDKDMLNADNQEDESVGQQRLQEIHGWPAQLWIQTSYNTNAAKHYDADGNLSSDQSNALRGNYAGVGYTWDEDNEIFWAKQPYTSWSKDVCCGRMLRLPPFREPRGNEWSRPNRLRRTLFAS